MVYLRGLHALRFIAALLVLVYHCNDGLRQLNSNLFLSFPILQKGSLAVHFFFILSGYLLTYLACHEYDKNGHINIKAFLQRRILRIFPLYYLSVFIGFTLIGFLYPMLYGKTFLSFTLSEGLPYYLLFLPNYPIVTWDNIGPMHSLWSIGVEEQFYIFFPFLILFGFQFKKLLPVLILALCSYLIFYYAVSLDILYFSEILNKFILKTLKFHFLLFGCVIGALLYYYPKNFIFRTMEYPIFQLLSIIVFIGYLFIIPNKLDSEYIFGGLIFTIIMINISKPKSLINLEIKPLVYLGLISYGIYVYHPFVSLGIRFIAERISAFQNLINTIPFIFYFIVFVLTILISHYSYQYFESWFLKKKNRV